MSSLRYWLWLSSATRVSTTGMGLLLSYYEDAETAFFAPPGEIYKIEGISKQDADILERRDLSRARSIFDTCREKGISMITMQDAQYPKRLKNIFAPPPVIYVRGNLPAVDDEAIIAVIGTRKAGEYGMSNGRRIAAEVCACGGQVVTAYTQGVDTAAIEGVLDENGVCIAVLGTGIEDKPSSLQQRILKRGAIVTECPPGTEADPGIYRARNRIISGLAVGVAVIEAPLKSGCHLLVEEALEQGKEIFALPGNADSPNSEGTISMLQQGARPIRSGRDIMREFSSRYPGKVRAGDMEDKPRSYRTKPTPESLKAAPTEKADDKKVIDKENGRGYIDLKERLAGLSEIQQKIAEAVEQTAGTIDEIVDYTGIGVSHVAAEITMMEISGVLLRSPGGGLSLNPAKSEEL